MFNNANPVAFFEVDGNKYTIRFESNHSWNMKGRLFRNDQELPSEVLFTMSGFHVLSFIELEGKIIMREYWSDEPGCRSTFFLVDDDRVQKLFYRGDCSGGEFAYVMPETSKKLININTAREISKLDKDGKFILLAWEMADGSTYSQECYEAYSNYLEYHKIHKQENRQCNEIHLEDVVGEFGVYAAITGDEDYMKTKCEESEKLNIHDFCNNYPEK